MMSKRIKTIVDLINPELNLLDIGTDHGIVPVEVLNKGFSKNIIATDINPKPLSRAEELINAYGFKDNVELRVGNGLEPVGKDEIDQIVIAGMGGEMIATILKDGLDKARYARKMILQPMTKVEELRKFLIDYGFNVSEDIIIEENQSSKDRFFHLLVVSNDKAINYSPYELLFGPGDLIKTSPEYKHYVKHKLDQYSKRIESMSNSDNLNTIRRRLEYERRFQFLRQLYES